MGRPTKLTPELQAKICNALRAGNFIEPVCAAYGIGSATFRRWMDLGADVVDPETGTVTRRAKPAFRAFRAAVEEAQAQPEVILVNKTYQDAIGAPVTCPHCGQMVSAAGESDPRAREFLLSRKFPDRWGTKDRHEHTGPGGGPIQTVKTVRFGGRWRKDGTVKPPVDPSTGDDASSSRSTSRADQ